MRLRVLTAIGLAPFVLGSFFCASPWPVFILGILAIGLCWQEFQSILKLNSHVGSLVLPFLVCGAFLVPFHREGSAHFTYALLAVICGSVGCLATRNCCSPGKNLIGIIFAPLWFATPIWCLVVLHGLGHPNSIWFLPNPILLAVVPLWVGDTAAIVMGKIFGKRLLAPIISPNKTVEGSASNFIASVAAATPLGMWIGYSWWVSLACGLIAGVFGQLGDLFESYVKRCASVKDSGALLPGHGGLLDRLDSILVSAPLVFAVLMLFPIP